MQTGSPESTAGRVRLIVNADDFGLTEGINRAVTQLFQAGALTSATLMANGPAFQHAVDCAHSNPGLAVGCHVGLLDGAPLAPPKQIAPLLGPDGALRRSLPEFLWQLQRGRIPPSAIRAEAIAQIRRLQANGIQPTHIDTHKHTHLFPRVAEPLLQAAAECGIRAVRNPFEEAWSARQARGALVRRMEVTLLRGFRRSFQSLVQQLDLITTDGSIGVSATGRLDGAVLDALLRAAPAGTWELVCHPGYNDVDLAATPTRLRSTRPIEMEALLSRIPAAAANGSLLLTSFAALRSPVS